jgi:hypothetical protein
MSVNNAIILNAYLIPCIAINRLWGNLVPHRGRVKDLARYLQCGGFFQIKCGTFLLAMLPKNGVMIISKLPDNVSWRLDGTFTNPGNPRVVVV